ncbi:diguanylate cyclase, partial [Escherichia coli]
DKVRDAIGSLPVDAEGVSVPVTASVGGACAKTGAPTSDVLVNEADAALYRAKRLGRDRSVAYA